MIRKRNHSLQKELNPVYYIFCEGETEEAYISFLKQKFRINIKIKSKITGQNISERIITNHIKEVSKGINSPKDKTFLMYDIDSPEIKTRLLNIKNCINLLSNPNIELWFLLHYRNQRAYISTANCTRDLIGFNKEYVKPKLNPALENILSNRFKEAIERAKLLTENENPSTTIYLFLEELIKSKGK